MSEDDRAAKAARARALLKKRQQQKVGGTAGAADSASIVSPSPPPSRTITPAPQEPQLHSPINGGKNGRNIGDLFSNGKSNGPVDGWLQSLGHVEAPDLPASPVVSPAPPATVATSPQMVAPIPVKQPVPRNPHQLSTKEDDGLRARIDEQERTIESLKAENATLQDTVQQSKDLEAELQKTLEMLNSEQSKTEKLQGFLEHTEFDIEQLTNQLEEQKVLVSSFNAEKSQLQRQLANTKSELQRNGNIVQEERNKNERLQGIIQRLEEEANQLDNQLQQKEKSIASLQFEKAALGASVERLKGIEQKYNEAQNISTEQNRQLEVLQEQVKELEATLEELRNKAEQQQQTISLLVSEKNNLTSVLERSQDAESKLQETAELLREEQTRAEQLQATVGQMESQGREDSERISLLTVAEKSLADKARNQERELQVLNSTLAELRVESEQHQRRARELEEQIESDDRAERLEAILQNTQDRATELEYQVSKLKQSQTTLKAERDQLETKLKVHQQSTDELQSRHADIEKAHTLVQDQLQSITLERDKLLQERSDFQNDMDKHQAMVQDLKKNIDQATSEHKAGTRALQQAQVELRAANRRAEEAEKVQAALQAEGVGLMKSLDEIRPKVVELTDAKLHLGEQVESLNKALKIRDDTIAQLEMNLEELKDQQSVADRRHQELNSALEKERSASSKNESELQHAYVELQKELEVTRSSAENLEDERTEYRQMAAQRLDEVDRLSITVQSLSEQAATLHAELGEHKRAREETQDVLHRVHAEVEVLRAELAAKDEEIQHLRETTLTPIPNGHQSLDSEMLDALRQQHALELSAAQSDIRSLETSVYQAETKAHTLQRQVAALEDQLAQLRSPSRSPQKPTVASRVSARYVDQSDELRRASFNSTRPVIPPKPPSPPPSFELITPEMRHKRKISLGMLKARIDSETASAKSQASSRVMSPATRTGHLPTVHEPLPRPGTPSALSLKRSQFLDESHIFWCHSCKGDLVIL